MLPPNLKTLPFLRWLWQLVAPHLLDSKISLPFFAGLCAIADGVTTILALESGLAYEWNSFAPTTLPGVMLHTFIKFAATQYIDEILPPSYAELMLKLSCAIWGAAAVSNSFAIMHAPQISSLLGATGFVLLFIYSTKNSDN